MRYLFALSLIVSIYSFAQNELKEISANTSDLRAANQLLTGVEKTALEGIVTRLTAKDQAVEDFIAKNLRVLDEGVKGKKSSLENELESMSKELTSKKMGPAHKDWEKFKVKFAEVSQNLAALTTEIENAKEQIRKYARESKLDADEVALKHKFDAFAKMLAEMNVTAHSLKWNDSVANYRDKLLDARVKLLALERAFDDKVMGGYVQAKLTRFANSELFCKASKQCTLDEKMRVPVDLNPLFFDETGSPRSNDEMKKSRVRSTIDIETENSNH